MAPQLIICAVTSNTQDGNLNKSGDNISTSGPHGRLCSDYYMGLNEVLDMKDLVNSNAVSLRSEDFFIYDESKWRKVVKIHWNCV